MKRIILGSFLSCMLVGQVFAAASSSDEPRVLSLQQLCTNAILRDRCDREQSEGLQVYPAFEELERAHHMQVERIHSLAEDLIAEFGDNTFYGDIDGMAHGDRVALAEQIISGPWQPLSQRFLERQAQYARARREALIRGAVYACDFSIGGFGGAMPFALDYLSKFISDQAFVEPVEKYMELLSPRLQELYAETPNPTDDQIFEILESVIGDKPEFIRAMQVFKLHEIQWYVSPVMLAGIGYLLAHKGEQAGNRPLIGLGDSLFSAGVARLERIFLTRVIPAGIRLLGHETLARGAENAAPLVHGALGYALIRQGDSRRMEMLGWANIAYAAADATELLLSRLFSWWLRKAL